MGGNTEELPLCPTYTLLDLRYIFLSPHLCMRQQHLLFMDTPLNTEFPKTQKHLCMGVYLWVCQSGDIRFEVVDDALGRSRQSGPAHQQH